MSAVLLKPCKGSHGFQGVTDRNLKLDLSRVNSLLLGEGFEEKMCVDIIMVVQKEDLEFTIYPSGKFLIKPALVNGTLSREKAEEEANALLHIYELSREQ